LIHGGLPGHIPGVLVLGCPLDCAEQFDEKEQGLRCCTVQKIALQQQACLAMAAARLGMCEAVLHALSILTFLNTSSPCLNSSLTQCPQRPLFHELVQLILLQLLPTPLNKPRPHLHTARQPCRRSSDCPCWGRRWRWPDRRGKATGSVHH